MWFLLIFVETGMANVSESSSSIKNRSKYNKLTKEDFERVLGMPISDLYKKECPSPSLPDPTKFAHELGMFYSHISSRKIKIQIKFGIANCEADGGGEDRGLIIVDFNLPAADVIKKIEGGRNLTSGTYTMQYFAFGDWQMFRNDIDWQSCLALHKGKKFVEVRALMRPPAW